MKIVKLGGSVITDKSKSKRLRKAVLDSLCEQIYRSGERVIVVHGAGSFGHILANRYKLQDGLDPKRGGEQAAGLSQVQSDMRELNLAVMASMAKAGMRPVSLPPSAIVRCDNKAITALDHTIFEEYLELGLTPVCFGDVVLDSELGFCICSGDQMMEALSERMSVSEVIFATGVDGLFTKPPGTPGAKLIAEMTPEHAGALNFGKAQGTDVTGGMLAKVQAAKRMAKRGICSIILNGNSKDRLLKALKGQRTVCTKIRSGVS